MRNIILTVLLTVSAFALVVYTSCSTKDKCDSITCVYGTCSEGVCTCYSGYTGTLCDKRLCEANNTARVRFLNKTGSSLTYTVVWDGSTLTSVGPGGTSDYYTVAAGQHTLHFMVTNGGGQEACTESSPVLVVCKDQEYWCTK